MNLKEMIEKRVKAIADARALTQKASDEKRDMTAQESEQFDKLMGEADSLGRDIERREKLEQAEKWLEKRQGRRTEPEAPGATLNTKPDEPVEVRFGRPGNELRIRCTGPTAKPEYRAAFNRGLVYGTSALTGDEIRALQADNDPTGGFLVAPQQFNAELIKFVYNLTFMRQIGRVLPPLTTAESLGTPSLDTDVADTDWTAEIATGSEDTALRIGKRELRPHPVAKRIKISKKLLRAASLDPEAIVMDRLAYKLAVTQEKAFLTGTGSQQPLGIFTAHANGISTGRDVSTGNTTTSITFDGLYEAKYALKQQYWQAASWIFHRDAMKQISKLKDGEGRYLWQPSQQLGQPDMLIGHPLRLSEYAPNTFTTGLYVGMIGDFNFYWIVDALNMTVQVLTELYAETNQNGYIVRAETDGAPVLEEAFARVKLA